MPCNPILSKDLLGVNLIIHSKNESHSSTSETYSNIVSCDTKNLKEIAERLQELKQSDRVVAIGRLAHTISLAWRSRLRHVSGKWYCFEDGHWLQVPVSEVDRSLRACLQHHDLRLHSVGSWRRLRTALGFYCTAASWEVMA